MPLRSRYEYEIKNPEKKQIREQSEHPVPEYKQVPKDKQTSSSSWTKFLSHKIKLLFFFQI